MKSERIVSHWPPELLHELRCSLSQILHAKRETPIRAIVVSGKGASFVAGLLEREVAVNQELEYYLVTDDTGPSDYQILTSLINDPHAINFALTQKGMNHHDAIMIHLVTESISDPVQWFAGWLSFAKAAGIIVLTSHQETQCSAANWLLSAANIGLIPDVDGCHRYPAFPGAVDYTLLYLQSRSYHIRHPEKKDIGSLEHVERLCWPEPIMMPTSILLQRISEHPNEHLVVLHEDVLEGVVYSQRIKSIDVLSQTEARTVHEYYDPQGRIVQLLALNVLPELQSKGLGGALLEFALQWITLHDVDTVVGVTRWSNYHAHGDLTPEKYLQAKSESGEPLDPVLKMHKKHGAEIRKLMPNYRPNDTENRGYGVLVQYDLGGRLMQKNRINQAHEAGVRTIEQTVENSIKGFLTEESEMHFTRSTPLMDLGFESLTLMELRDNLSKIFNEDIPATFFFQYSNTQAVIDYFIESKLYRYYDWLYDLEFRNLHAPRVKAMPKDDVWLIFVDERGSLATPLITELTVKGQRCISVRLGSFFQALSDHEYQVSLNKDDFIRLFQALKDQPIVGVCYLLGVVSDIPEEPDIYFVQRYHHQLCSGLIYLVQAMYSALFQRTPSLWVVTWAARARGNAQSLVTMPFESLCNAIIMEHPEFKCRRISLDIRDNIKNSVQQCLREFSAEDKQDQVFWIENKRYSPRLIHLKLPKNYHAPQLNPEASYIIVGGCGGLGNMGLYAAKWHVDNGAKYLILMDPHPISPASQVMIDSFKAQGVHVDVHIQDVTKLDALTAVFENAQKSLPPIKGITHALDLVDDDKLVNMTWERFENILQYKVPVAWHLHCLSKSLELDHFILFSAIGPILGPKWRASRASANAFLGALAHYRASLNLPALAIDWGPWTSSVAATDPIYETNLPMGLNKVDAEQGITILNLIYHLPTPQVVVADIDWIKMLSRNSLERPLLFDMQSEYGMRSSEILMQLEGLSDAKHNEAILSYLLQHVRRVLYTPVHINMDSTQTLRDLGLDELRLHEFKQNIQHDLAKELEIPNSIFTEQNTLMETAEKILDCIHQMKLKKNDLHISTEHESRQNEPVAIIGMACRFPGGANTPDQFWKILHDGKDVITEVPADRWDINTYYDSNKNVSGKMYTRFGGFIENVDLFDPQFFGISPREADDMDPQQRICLEVTWEALENAGIPARNLKGSKAGVFVGICSNDYGQLIRQSGNIAALDNYYSTGNHYSMTAGRISYFFGLEGPAMAIDTACSSSLVSIDIAVKHLQLGECDLAIAGGVNLIITPESTINFCKSGMLADDGHCKTFDEKANGYVRSEGCGMLILKRLTDAIKNKDRILAVIRSTAINQDGASTGLTVPNQGAQERVIEAALKAANLNADEVQYVEAHGTGTSLGDPIEVQAISETYGKNRGSDNPIILGSIKANIGHAEAAAGVAGVIKCVLSLVHEEIPRQLYFNKLNPKINIDVDKIKIANTPIVWNRQDSKRFAAVSSFGFSGTNSHAIIGEAPEPNQSDPEKAPFILLLSAKSESALDDQIRQMIDFIKNHLEINLSDMAYTLQVGREHFQHRRVLVGNSRTELCDKPILLSAGVRQNEYQLSMDMKMNIEKWLSGCDVDWRVLYTNQSRNIISLPTYPFQRDRYWVKVAIDVRNKALDHMPDQQTHKQSRTFIKSILLDLPEKDRDEVLQSYLMQQVRKVLELREGQSLEADRGFFEIGMDSIMAIKLVSILNEDLDDASKLTPTSIFNYPSVEKLLVLYKSNILPECFKNVSLLGLSGNKREEEESHRVEQEIMAMSEKELKAMFNNEVKDE